MVRELQPTARTHGGGPTRAAEAASLLLAIPMEVGVLCTGDSHHENVLDPGTRGWLAIGPKRLYACKIATRPERFAHRLKSSSSGRGRSASAC